MQRRATARVQREESAHRRCRARLVRPRAPPPAVAGGARRGARSLPRMAQRDHAAADDGQGGAAALRSLPAPLARRGAHWRAPSSARCSPPGPASAITRVRATCMLARAWWRSGTGAEFPDDEAGLRKLPGVGDYTAAAIAAIAFGKRATPVDGNIERVVARLFAVTTPLPAAKTEIRALAETLTPDDAARRLRPGDDGSWAPRSARRAGRPAALCPVRPDCRGFAEGLRRGTALSRGEGRAAGQARRNLRCRSRRWRRAAPRAAVAWPVGRHAGDAVIALGAGRTRRKLRTAIRAGRGRLAQAARPGRAHFHAFSSGAFRLSRGGRTGCAAKARGGARALPLAQTSRTRGRRAAVGHAEGVAARPRRRSRRQPCGSSFARAASRKASIGVRRPSAS